MFFMPDLITDACVADSWPDCHAQTGASSPTVTYRQWNTPLPLSSLPFPWCRLPNHSGVMDSFLQNAACRLPWKPPLSQGQRDVAPNSWLLFSSSPWWYSHQRWRRDLSALFIPHSLPVLLSLSRSVSLFLIFYFILSQSTHSFHISCIRVSPGKGIFLYFMIYKL